MEKAKQVVGIVLGLGLLYSFGWKLMDGLSGNKNSEVILFLVFIVFILIVAAVMKILRD